MSVTESGPRRALLAIALACLGGVLLALWAQHGFDIRPCPWCILQRLLFLLIAVACLAGAASPSLTGHRLAAGMTILLAAGGMASALWQNVVASRSASCDLTLADRIVGVLKLEALAPDVFQVTASCAEAAVKVLGVPFEIWSLALFALASLAAAAIIRGTKSPG
jgi:disulfide bond formation protein DsbB